MGGVEGDIARTGDDVAGPGEAACGEVEQDVAVVGSDVGAHSEKTVHFVIGECLAITGNVGDQRVDTCVDVRAVLGGDVQHVANDLASGGVERDTALAGRERDVGRAGDHAGSAGQVAVGDADRDITVAGHDVVGVERQVIRLVDDERLTRRSDNRVERVDAGVDRNAVLRGDCEHVAGNLAGGGVERDAALADVQGDVA